MYIFNFLGYININIYIYIYLELLGHMVTLNIGILCSTFLETAKLFSQMAIPLIFCKSNIKRNY